MKNLITIVLIALSFTLTSQERRETINGEEFIIHTVKKGETLYGISSSYKVSKKEVRSANSGMLLFIKVGQELRIPVAEDNKQTHIVKRGETLYGISKKYKMTVEELIKLNPKSSSGVKVGDKLVLNGNSAMESIPPSPPPPPSIGNTKKHTVSAGETLYSIARKYGISVEKLKLLNPGLKENLSIGDKINVPNKNVILEKKIEPVINPKIKQIEYKVERGETLYGIARKYNTSVEKITTINPDVTSLKEGDVIKINLPAEYMNEVKVNLGDPIEVKDADFNKINKINPLKDKLNEMVKKETYSVSLFLPFMLDKNEKIPLVTNKPKRIEPWTERSTHFYNGAMLAMDSAKSSGVSFELAVYDTEKDTGKVKRYLRSEAVKSTDLIIGPIFPNPYKQIARFSKSNQIQAISPVNQSNRVLFDNKYVTELITSKPTQVSYLAKYIANNKNTENVVCVSGMAKEDKYLAKSFSKIYNESIAGKSNNYRSKASTFSMTSFSSMRGFEDKLVKGKNNVIVIPITTAGGASAFFTQLNVAMVRSRMRGYKVELYALENFMDYDNININMKLKYNLHIATSSYINYKNENVKNFVKKYRKKYGTEPNRYAFMGFDATFYHVLALSNFGKNYTAFYGQMNVPLLQTNFNLQRTDSESGFENQSVDILLYKDFELVKVN